MCYLEHDAREVADWIIDLFIGGNDSSYTVRDVISDGIGLEDDLLAILGLDQDTTDWNRRISSTEWQSAYERLGFDLNEDVESL